MSRLKAFVRLSTFFWIWCALRCSHDPQHDQHGVRVTASWLTGHDRHKRVLRLSVMFPPSRNNAPDSSKIDDDHRSMHASWGNSCLRDILPRVRPCTLCLDPVSLTSGRTQNSTRDISSTFSPRRRSVLVIHRVILVMMPLQPVSLPLCLASSLFVDEPPRRTATSITYSNTTAAVNAITLASTDCCQM